MSPENISTLQLVGIVILALFIAGLPFLWAAYMDWRRNRQHRRDEAQKIINEQAQNENEKLAKEYRDACRGSRCCCKKEKP